MDSIMLAGLGILGLLFAILLKREDKQSGFGLELSAKRNFSNFSGKGNLDHYIIIIFCTMDDICPVSREAF